MIIILIISFLEEHLKIPNNNSNNKNCAHDAPFFIIKATIKGTYHLLMTMTSKSLKQNLIKMNNNLKLVKKFMFHIHISIAYYQILIMHGIYFKPMLYAKIYYLFIDYRGQKSSENCP